MNYVSSHTCWNYRASLSFSLFCPLFDWKMWCMALTKLLTMWALARILHYIGFTLLVTKSECCSNFRGITIDNRYNYHWAKKPYPIMESTPLTPFLPQIKRKFNCISRLWMEFYKIWKEWIIKSFCFIKKIW